MHPAESQQTLNAKISRSGPMSNTRFRSSWMCSLLRSWQESCPSIQTLRLFVCIQVSLTQTSARKSVWSNFFRPCAAVFMLTMCKEQGRRFTCRLKISRSSEMESIIIQTPNTNKWMNVHGNRNLLKSCGRSVKRPTGSSLSHDNIMLVYLFSENWIFTLLFFIYHCK